MKNKLRSRWPLLFSIIIALIFISYFCYKQITEPSVRTNFIMIYGIIGIVLIVFLSLYIVRKNISRYRLGSTQSWLQAHIYIGIISLVIILIHSGFDFTGIFSIVFLIIFLLVIVSGIVGSLIYKTIPLSLTKYGRDVKSEIEIVSDMEKYIKEADKLVSNASPEFREIYQKKIRPSLKSKRTKWGYLLMEERELIDKRRAMMENFKKLVLNQDIYDLNILSSILIEKERLSFMLTKLKLQQAWLNFHMPLTSALLTMAVIHILSLFYF